MRASGNARVKTLYEVLGVRPDAKVAEIALACQRIRDAMKQETAAPDPALAAMAQVALETLTDPETRALYDRELAQKRRAAHSPKRGRLMAAAGAGLLVLAGLVFWFARGPGDGGSSADRPLSPEQVAAAIGPHVGRVQLSLMSGETRDAGLALAMGENEMVTTCRAMVGGALVAVKLGDSTTKAELTRVSEARDICVLGLHGPASGVKVRAKVPLGNEKLHALVVAASGPPQLHAVSVERAIEDPNGAAFALHATAPLPNGTPIVDAQARLVGLVAAPHAYGEGIVAALGAARLSGSRTSAP